MIFLLLNLLSQLIGWAPASTQYRHESQGKVYFYVSIHDIRNVNALEDTYTVDGTLYLKWKTIESTFSTDRDAHLKYSWASAVSPTKNKRLFHTKGQYSILSEAFEIKFRGTINFLQLITDNQSFPLTLHFNTQNTRWCDTKFVFDESLIKKPSTTPSVHPYWKDRHKEWLVSWNEMQEQKQEGNVLMKLYINSQKSSRYYFWQLSIPILLFILTTTLVHKTNINYYRLNIFFLSLLLLLCVQFYSSGFDHTVNSIRTILQKVFQFIS